MFLNISIYNNSITDYSPLAQIADSHPELEQIYFRLGNAPVSLQFIEKFNKLKKIQVLSITTNQNFTDNITDKYMKWEPDSQVLEFVPCKNQCGRCSSDDVCVTCLDDSRLRLVGSQCQLIYPDFGYSISLDFSTLRINNAKLGEVIDTVINSYCVKNLTSLKLVLIENQFDDYDIFGRFADETLCPRLLDIRLGISS